MPDDVIISDDITIPASELEFAAVRARGAGGQNVNKVSSAIHLRFDIATSTSLPRRLRERLLALNDHRITEDGIVIIKAQEHRTQERNRRAARERLTELIQSVLADPKPRKKTQPSRRSKQQRLTEKRQRSALKKDRSKISDWRDD